MVMGAACNNSIYTRSAAIHAEMQIMQATFGSNQYLFCFHKHRPDTRLMSAGLEAKALEDSAVG